MQSSELGIRHGWLHSLLVA